MNIFKKRSFLTYIPRPINHFRGLPILNKTISSFITWIQSYVFFMVIVLRLNMILFVWPFPTVNDWCFNEVEILLYSTEFYHRYKRLHKLTIRCMLSFDTLINVWNKYVAIKFGISKIVKISDLSKDNTKYFIYLTI